MPGSYISSAIDFAHISKTFGGVKALKDVSFEVKEGEVHCLAGVNGSGKSTLIKIIAGAYTPEPGASMTYFGHAEKAITPVLARKRGIAVIWQDLALFSHMTVAENIAFETLLSSVPKPVSHRKIRNQAHSAIELLGVELDLDARLHTLPIAQRQLVAIARALVGDAKLIFMDEPTASLTQTETNGLLKVVRSLSARGVAIVFVSHRLAEVLEISSRVTVLRDGSLIGVYDTAGMTQSKLTELMTGECFDSVVAARDRSAAAPVLEVDCLARPGEFKNVSLTIRSGEVVGLIGLIGAGRTELAHTLFGMTKAHSGQVKLNGKTVTFRSNRDAIKHGVGYLSEDRLTLGLIQPQSIADNQVLAVLPRLSNVFGLISPSRKKASVDQWIKALGIKLGNTDDAISTLSGGNQQRVALAKWLSIDPKVLILDAPTVGVDVSARAGIFKIVRRLAEEGLAILLISDEVPEVYFNADRVMHMEAGEVIAEYDPRVMDLQKMEESIYG